MILAQAFSRFAIDLDGVLWRGERPIAGAPETVNALREAGKRVAFVTNNSSATPEAYAKRLADIGAPSDPADIVTSAHAVAELLPRTVPGIRGRLATVIGGEGLRDAVRSTGARVAEDADSHDASLVVVGWDRDFTFDRLRAATLAIRSGATFVASNTDATFPAADGLWPGAGAIVAAIATATGVEPMVAGKPETTMLDVAADRLGGGPALAIGDRVETDIAAAQAAGWPSVLVMSGVTDVPSLALARAWPDYIIGRLSDLLEDRAHPRVRAAAGPDLPHVAALLHAGGLRSGAARERIGRTLVAEVDRTPVATAGWEDVDGVALLRSVAVADDIRRGGVGRLIVAAALRQIAGEGLRDVYLVTESGADFFARCGFERIDRDELPDPIADHKQVTVECPVDATAMRLRLPDRQ